MQAMDKAGVADFLGITLATLNRRINANQFPKPDQCGSANSPDTDWWERETLEKYQRALARKKRPRKK